MKKIGTMLAALCCGTFLFSAPQGASTPEGWYDDFASAQKAAKEQNRPLLLLITGSDWCPWCIRLKENVLLKNDFKKFAAEKLIPVYVDLPNNLVLPQKLIKQNRELAAKYNPQGGVPYSVIVNANGDVLGKISGYSKSYVKDIRKIIEKK